MIKWGVDMNMDRIKYRYWEHEVWDDPTSPLVAKYTDIVAGCDPTVAVGDFEFCTGLKDKNCNLIYEGDVLLCDRKDIEGATGAETHYKSSGVVQRDKNGKYFIDGKDWYGSDITFYNECAEIIGNIHEQKDNK